MNLGKPILPTAIALAALVGCTSRPSEAFVDLVKKDRIGTAAPEITIRLGRAIEERTFAGDKESSLRQAMEVLGNQMGVRIEASTGGTKYMPVTQYTLVDVKDPGLQGISIVRDADLVRIRPNFQRDVIIESATSPKEGFEKMMAAATSTKDKASAEAMLSLFGDKDAKGTAAKMEAMDLDTRNKKALDFETNVDRIRKDNGYAKAWFVTYRIRQSTNLPAESPFWMLVDALGKARTKDVIEKNAAFVLSSAFWTAHGKQDIKATLVTYSVVAFHDSKGALAKIEGWQAFKGE